MEMFKRQSLITRIAIGKIVGLVVGLIGFAVLPMMVPDATLMLRWGVLLWYTTLGAIIGVFGVFTWHPILHLPMPWWIRAPMLGAWMNFVLVFFSYDQMQHIMFVVMGESGIITSPFWFVSEGAVVGLLIGCFATTIGGEGKAIIEEKP